jgi:HSP20 family protein
MADIVKKGGQPQQQVARPAATREWSPWQRMREILAWDPFQEMSRFWHPEEPSEGFMPAFEVRECRDEYLFRADLPGVNEDDIEVNVTGNRLTVSGKREAEQRHENERFYAYEVQYGTFSRSFTLPEGVEINQVKADLRNGVLTLHVPKKAEAQPRRIPLGGTGGKPKAST